MSYKSYISLNTSIISLLISIFIGLICFTRLSINPQLSAADLTWPLHGARVLLSGGNPYRAAVGPIYSPDTVPLLYPLPAVLLLVPLTPLPDPVAAGLFISISTYLLLLRARWTILLCAPFWYTVINAQWSILLCAAMLSPWLAPLFACKPTTGSTIVAVRPYTVIYGLIILILPWLTDWLANIRHAPQQIPALIFPPLLLAVLRWRDPRARILLALSIMPVRPLWYDQLSLYFVCPTWIWIICGWVAYIAWVWSGQVNDAAQWFVVVGCYAPALCYALKPLHARRA